jgi:hypothetical protein
MLRGWAAVLAVCGVLSAGALHAKEIGTALKADDIKAEPYKDAKNLGKIAKGDTLEILARQSGWLRVKLGTREGWVRMLSVRRGQAGAPDVAREVGGIAGVATGRAGTGQVVSATGVRGLSEADLKDAKFDEAQVALAESYAATADAAQSFAALAQLKTRRVDPLPDPRQGR